MSIKVKVIAEYELDITNWYTDDNDKPFRTEKALQKINEDLDNEIFQTHMPNNVDYSAILIK